MPRIRTVKPELFLHEDLFDLEEQTGLPVRLAFIGLFTCCDREGRFKWKPRSLKASIMPFDEIDFSRVLDALATRGFVVKYASDSSENTGVFGFIPGFTLHQVINNRESQSVLPEPFKNNYMDVSLTREPRVSHADKGERKGKERKGKERKEICSLETEINEKQKINEMQTADAVCATKKTVEEEAKKVRQAVWQAYADAYFRRYGTEPLRNAKVNGQVAQFCKRLPADEAPHVAAFYLTHPNRWYVQKGHEFGQLLNEAEKLRTEWATNRKVTARESNEEDRIGGMAQAVAEIKAEMGWGQA